MNILSVIPARGGSKSIPRKNIKIFNGYPLIKYSIDYSLKSSIIDNTIVSTEDHEIAEVAKENGAEVPFMRSKKFSGDDIQDFPVIQEALMKSEKIYNKIYDYIILLRPTSPIRPPGLIEKGIKLLSTDDTATSLRSVIKSSEHPYRQWMRDGNYIKGFFENTMKETYNLPRQELVKCYFQSGDIEIIKRATIISGSVSGKRVIPLEIDQNDVSDIDNLNDFKDAEEKFRKK
tara:strand:+ start:766 stop:1461 length:696 start_codon:yes stop_codon:yes gene_type:complete